MRRAIRARPAPRGSPPGRTDNARRLLHSVRSRLSPLLHGHHGSGTDLGSDLEFIHESPRAWQPDAETFPARVTVLHHETNVGDARTAVARDDLHSGLRAIAEQGEDDLAAGRELEDIA